MKKTVRRLFALLLVIIMAASLAACGKKEPAADTPASGDSVSPAASQAGSSPAADPGTSDSAPAATGRDTIDVAVESDDGTLDPTSMTGGMYQAIQCVYEPLWDVTEEGEIIYVLAESVEEVEPARWIVHLRQGVTFSNGNPFTVDDVLFSIPIWKAAGWNAVRAQSIDPETTCAIDDYTLDLRMVDYYVMNWSACSLFTIYDQESYNADTIATQPIGTGPYVVSDYIMNSQLVLERRDDYWGETPDIKYIRFRLMAESSQVVNGLNTGMIDIGPVALGDYDFVESLPNFSIDARYAAGGITLGFNSGVNGYFNRYEDPVKSLEARYAVIHAIDPQVLIDLVYEGKGKIMDCAVPDFCFDYQPQYKDMHSTYEIGYNVEVAKQYAESSGLAGQTITIMTNGLAREVQTAEILQNMLAQIGVTLEINNYDPATAVSMAYDPESSHDLSIGQGIAPNRRVCDLLVNGVRYSAVLSAPGAFPNNEHYLEIAPLTIHTPDETERLKILEEVLYMYIDNALSFSLCEIQIATAVSNDLNMSTIRRSICTGAIRFMDLKWA